MSFPLGRSVAPWLSLVSIVLLLLQVLSNSGSLLHAAENKLVQEILTSDADIEYGEYLAGECLTCHLLSGAADGVPVIARLPAEQIIHSLLEYKSGSRENQVMRSVANNLGNDEIAALALYFSTIE